jgi:hypothetical protein
MFCGLIFKVLKGLGKVTPFLRFFSMLLFNIWINRSLKLEHMICWFVLVPHLIEKVLAIIQSVDDIVLCITHNPEKAINLKFLMYLFDLMYGLKINYKSEIFLVGGDNEIAD